MAQTIQNEGLVRSPNEEPQGAEVLAEHKRNMEYVVEEGSHKCQLETRNKLQK